MPSKKVSRGYSVAFKVNNEITLAGDLEHTSLIEG